MAWAGLRHIRAHLYLVRTRMLFRFIGCIWIFVLYICILDSSEPFLYISCGFHRELVYCLLFHTHRVHVSICTRRLVGVSKATSCVLRRERRNSQGGDFGASQVVSEPRLSDTRGSSLPVG